MSAWSGRRPAMTSVLTSPGQSCVISLYLEPVMADLGQPFESRERENLQIGLADDSAGGEPQGSLLIKPVLLGDDSRVFRGDAGEIDQGRGFHV